MTLAPDVRPVTGDVVIDDVGLRKFKIEAVIRSSADAREIEPLHVPRLASSIAGAAFQKKSDPAEELLRQAGVKGKTPKSTQPAKKTSKSKGLAGVNGLKE